MNKNLETLDKLIKSKNSNTVYQTKNGNCVGINLYNEPDIGVMRVYMEKGAEFPEHIHKTEKEIGIVYSGKLLIRRGDEAFKMKIGDHFYFEKGEPHAAKALEDCWLICVSVPSAKGYPNG